MIEATIMTAVVAFISQKGGVGKSTLARALAREAASSDLRVKIADLDAEQATCIDWHKTRMQRGVEPVLAAELFRTVAEAIKAGASHDLLVIDGPAMASTGTTEIAKRAHLIVQPTGSGLDDLRPAVRVFHGLVKAGVAKNKLVFALNHIGTEPEAEAARAYIQEAGYTVLPGYLPERPAYRQAQNDGLAITETRFASLKKQADTLIQALIDRVGEATHG
ncbi:MAG: AAA family ATPase [Rhodopila sp.]|jgi:chromosome partitioning protein